MPGLDPGIQKPHSPRRLLIGPGKADEGTPSPLVRRELTKHHQAMAHWVYILASRRNGTLYVGVTRNLARRIYEHKTELTKGFTSKYGVKTLVYAEPHDLAINAIQREKNLKHWSRKWKLDLIESMNPHWDDLFEVIL